MRALIFEPQFVGHNLVYVRHIAQALLELGVQVHLLTSRQALDSEEFAKHLGGVSHLLDVTASNRFANASKSGGVRVNGTSGILSSVRALLDGLKGSEPDHFYLPFGNPLAHALGVPSPIWSYLRGNRIESEIVLLSGKYAYKHTDLASRAKQELSLALLANGPWTRIHHIVPYAIDVMLRHGSRVRQVANLLPDPIDTPISMTKGEARRMLGLDAQSRYVSLVGLIDQRKGVGDLLSAGRQLWADERNAGIKILLAGKNSEEARTLLGGEYRNLVSSGQVAVLDRHLSQKELWAACIASDLITTPYPKHRNSASILIRAAAVGVPVLANTIGWMEDVTNRYELGWTCDTRNAEEFSELIRSILSKSECYVPSRLSREFVDFHTVENFQDQITAGIRRRMGIDLAEPRTVLDYARGS